MAYIDLHTHSTASDGTLSPTALIRAAHAAGLAALALTDHDTGNGLDEAAAEAQRLGLIFVPGIEISADFPSPGTMHILGHFIDPHSPGLTTMSKILMDARNERNPKIIARLNQLGCAITMDQVRQIAQQALTNANPRPSEDSALKEGGGTQNSALVLGRPHIAQALVNANCVANIKQAFDVYLGTTGSAFFPKERLSPRQAIECIHAAGGLATLAHPIHLLATNPAHLATIINHLADAGLDGLECYHCDHDQLHTDLYLQLANRYHLLPTGGSDYHGHNKAGVLLGRGRNNVKVPFEIYTHLHARWQQRQTTPK